MASRAGTPTPWTIPLQATRVLLARAPTTLLLHRQAGLTVPMRWAIAGPRLSPPRPVAPKPRSLLWRSVGPTHACQTAPSELSLAAVLHYIAFWGFTGFGPFPARSPPPGQHAYNVLPYTPNTHYVYRASRCKCEIVKWSLETKFIN